MENSDILFARNKRLGGVRPSFPLRNRIERVLWTFAWFLLARWTWNGLNLWRLTLARAFGAQVASTSRISPSARIWLPRNLFLKDDSTLGPHVDCYNLAPIVIGERTIISQRSVLCAGSHEIDEPSFQLIARPINIGSDVWIAAEAFVGPGVTIGDGCVLGARGCAFSDLSAWTVYRGNPAVRVKGRGWLTPVPKSPNAV